MVGLAKQYSREITQELDMIPVYFPGTKVSPGDIISFKHKNLLGRPQPIGQFKKDGSLGDLGIQFETEEDPVGSVNFSSREGVSVNFDASANAGSSGDGKLDVTFKKEGSTYMVATDLTESRIKSIDRLRPELNKRRGKYSGDWNEVFIVVSVRTAERALVMQSNSSQGSLTISGNLDAMETGDLGTIDAGFNLSVSAYKDAAFIRPWSENVEMFIGLMRYRKRFLGGWQLGRGFAPSNANDWELNSLHPDEVDLG